MLLRRGASDVHVAVAADDRIVNAMTIDVEDYFHVSVFDGIVPRARVGRAGEPRRARNTERLLEHLRRDRRPRARSSCSAGSPSASRAGARDRRARPRGRLARLRAPAGLRPDAGGVPRGRPAREGAARGRAAARRCVGYRAPSYSITPRSLWALDVLIEEGYRYDASIFPIRHDRYGIPVSPRHPYVLQRGAARSSKCRGRRSRWGPMNLPVGGGGYFRILPYGWTRWGIGRLNDGRDGGRRSSTCTRGRSIRISRGCAPALLSRFRHYRNLERDRRAAAQR